MTTRQIGILDAVQSQEPGWFPCSPRVRRGPEAVHVGPTLATYHTFASCCHWANVPFYHFFPPSPQTLDPLSFTKGVRDTPGKGPLPPAVEPLSDLGDRTCGQPVAWASGTDRSAMR